jgi:hypothetical protein
MYKAFSRAIPEHAVSAIGAELPLEVQANAPEAISKDRESSSASAAQL